MKLGFAAVLVGALASATAAQAEPRMLKGPYLQDLAPTSITIMWQAETPAPARLVVSGPGGEKVQEVTAARIAEAQVTDLQPASRYRYRVEMGGKTWDGELTTAPPIGKDVPFSFTVIGDTRYGMEPHRRVAERMVQDVPDFILGTGDMVDDGSRQDQWQQFFDVENPLLRNNVYFPAVGNHDRQGRGRTADTYRSYFSVPDNGGDSERYYAFTYATSRFLILDSNVYSFALTDQTAWLERELIAARQDAQIRHIFVVMHHPPFSVSLHGGSKDLRERWTPLFEKYQVSAVFSGHDHVYTRAEHNTVRYFVSGGGGAPLYPRRPKANPIDVEAVRKFERVFHYLRVQVSGARIEVTGVRADGTIIETTTWSDGPEPPASRPAKDDARVRAVGAAPPTPAIASIAPPPALKPDRSFVWIGVGAVGLLLAAAVLVVRTLRR